MAGKLKASHINIFTVIAALVFLSLLPMLIRQSYWMSFLFNLFMYTALSESWNIIGNAGYISLGHVAFFGIGAYTTSLLSIHLGVSPFLMVPIGGILASIVAAIFGYPCLRLWGPYFTITTFCMVLAIQALAMNLKFTGLGIGFWMPLLPFHIFVSRVIFYEVMLGLLAAVIFIVWRVRRSKFGLGLSSIREEENTAQTLGVNVTQLKMYAFMLSAFLVGVVGGIYAYYYTYINPEIMFDIFVSISMVLMCLLGGTQSIFGPAIGAVIVTALNELLTVSLGIQAEISRIIYGLMLVVVIIFLPDGIMSLVRKRDITRVKRKKLV